MQLLPSKSEACHTKPRSCYAWKTFVFVSCALKMDAAGSSETSKRPAKQHGVHKTALFTVTVLTITNVTWIEEEKSAGRDVCT